MEEPGASPRFADRGRAGAILLWVPTPRGQHANEFQVAKGTWGVAWPRAGEGWAKGKLGCGGQGTRGSGSMGAKGPNGRDGCQGTRN